MSAVTQKTFEDIYALVREHKKQEGAEPSPNVYPTLLRECLARIFRLTKAYDTTWDNDTDGDLSLSGNEAALPHDCLIVVRVEWDGSENPLEIVDEAYLDYNQPGWRDATGEPGRCAITGRRLFLDSKPSGDLTGKLVLRGFGVPPDNLALSYLPFDLQLSPHKYILWKLPYDPEKAIERARYERFGREWAEDEPLILDAVKDRIPTAFTYP